MLAGAARGRRRRLAWVASAAIFLFAGDAAGERAALQPGAVFRDCPACPEMVVVPAGTFTMGSPETERGRLGNEGPQRRVSIARPFALGKYEVTRGEWAAFVRATGHPASGWCFRWNETTRMWGRDDGADWSKPGFAQTDRHPAVCVNWHDAKAYVAWLSRETGGTYRLPSEAEWEYAARAGTATSHIWGDDPATACRQANGADASAKTKFAEWTVMPCDDGHVFTAPVGTYAGNGFGLHDMSGNVSEWVEDCWHPNYAGAPVDGSAWVVGGDCSRRVARGGAWTSGARHLRAADRNHNGSMARNIINGFRIARTLD